uniref:Cathepsin propeptide inhibitor domain-containing protein n=1 Tax=Brassica campestris TaxID=3711 RepID=M4CR22_BRACM
MSMRAILSLVVLVLLIGSHESTPISDALKKLEDLFAKILGQSDDVLSFARFTQKYGKKYQNKEEIKHRFSVFQENLDLIGSTNKKGLPFKLGVNKFADLTNQEFLRNKFDCSRFGIFKGRHNVTDTTTIPSAFDENKLKQWVASIGPVTVGFHVTNSFAFYEEGVYTSDECGDTTEDLNHFMLVVGYGVEDGVPYWLIQNSWGADWGEKGYIKVEMGKNMCESSPVRDRGGEGFRVDAVAAVLLACNNRTLFHGGSSMTLPWTLLLVAPSLSSQFVAALDVVCVVVWRGVSISPAHQVMVRISLRVVVLMRHCGAASGSQLWHEAVSSDLLWVIGVMSLRGRLV